MSRTTNLVARILTIVLMVGGVGVIVAGGVAWATTSSELASQKVNVAAEGESENIANGPFDALSQISLIQEHTAAGIEKMGFPAGTVYAEVPMPDAKEVAACKSGKSEKTADECAELIKNDSARAFFDNSNSKQASLYTSVLAFGVSALVVGIGIVMIIVGWLEFIRTGNKARVAIAS